MNPRVALVYDRVNTPYGGAEKVLLALHEVFPYAPLYTSVFDADQASWAQRFKLRTSWLQKIPFANRLHRWLAPLMPLAFESFDLSEFEIIISITSAEAKGILTKPDQLHICYLLTPTRYLYSHRDEYLESLPDFPGIRSVAGEMLSYLRWWDQSAAWRPDVIIPISQVVAARSELYYGRKTDPVLYPPVDLDEQDLSEAEKAQVQKLAQGKPYYLVVSRLVDYKRIDLAIAVCQTLGKRLIVVGEGPQEAELRELSTQSPDLLSMVGTQSKGVVRELMKGAEALLMPGLEDFGITALEVVAQGTPVILPAKSGVAELLTEGESALFLEGESEFDLVSAILAFEQKPFRPVQVRKKLAKYATTIFCERFEAVVTAHWLSHQKERNS